MTRLWNKLQVVLKTKTLSHWEQTQQRA